MPIRVDTAHPEQRHPEAMAQQARMPELLAEKHSMPLAVLQAQLAHLVEIEIPSEQVSVWLDTFVTEYLKLKEDWATPTNAAPEVASARARALDLVDGGDLEGARVLFMTARTQLRERRPEATRLEATLLADRARIDILQVRYGNAIALYEEAADLCRFDTEAASEYQMALVNVLINQGYEFLDNAALVRAVDIVVNQALPLVQRERAPLAWAAIQNSLGNALQILGRRESGTSRLEQAVAAYQAALEECIRERAPSDWAEIQHSLGNALQVLGRRVTGTSHLEQAVTAYRAVLEERTRERAPLDWAAMQNALGNALQVLGRRETGTSRLEQAVAAYQAALEERTREREPLDWAAIQNSLGNALQELGWRETGTSHLEQAVTAYRTALEECTRERAPSDWAAIQNSLGDALQELGWRETDTSHLEQAREVRESVKLRHGEDRTLRYQFIRGDVRVRLNNNDLVEGEHFAVDRDRGAIMGLTRDMESVVVDVSYIGYPQRYDLLWVADDGNAGKTAGQPRKRNAEEWRPQPPEGALPTALVFRAADIEETIPYEPWVARPEWLAWCRVRLPKTLAKLASASALRLGLYGDSISGLGDGGGEEMNTSPNGVRDRIDYFDAYDAATRALIPVHGGHHREGFGWRTVRHIEKAFGVKVEYRNWGISGTDTASIERVGPRGRVCYASHPIRLNAVASDGCDVVLVAFGANELGEAGIRDNLNKIGRRLRDGGAELIVIGPPRPHPRFGVKTIDHWRFTHGEIMLAARDLDCAYIATEEILAPENLHRIGLSCHSLSAATCTNHPGRAELNAIGDMVSAIFVPT